MNKKYEKKYEQKISQKICSAWENSGNIFLILNIKGK